MPPSPWSTCTRFMLSSFTWSGVSAWNSGLNPLKSTVRSRDGLGLLDRDGVALVEHVRLRRLLPCSSAM